MSANIENHLNNIRGNPFIKFCNIIGTNVRQLCSNITNFEIGFILGIIWNGLSDDEKSLYDEQNNIITPLDIRRISDKFLAYLSFRSSIVNSISTIDLFTDDEPIGKYLINSWIELTNEQRNSYKII